MAQKKNIMDRLTFVESKWLLEYKLPKVKDKDGIKYFSVEFMNKFGKTRFDSLFKSPGSLYVVAGLVQSKNKPGKKQGKASHKKATRKKGEPYTDEEKQWLLEYPIPKPFGKDAHQTLADEHHKQFPNRPRRTPEAIAWKVMNLRGLWNPVREISVAKPAGKKQAKGTTMERQVHRHLAESNSWIRQQPHPAYKDEALKKKLTDEFNAKFSDAKNPKVSVGAYYHQSARVHGFGKKKVNLPTRIPGFRKGKVYGPKQLVFLMDRIPKSRNFRLGELEKLRKDFNKEFGLNVTRRSIEVKCSRIRKFMKSMPVVEAVQIPSVPISRLVQEDKVPPYGVMAEGQVVWTGNHEPSKEAICVTSGVSSTGEVLSTIIIEGHVPDKVFKSKPKPVVCSFKEV